MAVVLAWTNAVVVGLSNALPMQVGVARVVFAMGRDRQMPHAFARVHPRYRTPYVGMLVTSAISLAVGLVMEYRLDDLASIVNFGALSGFLLLHTSVLVRFAIKQRSRQIVAHWIVPICGFLVVLAVFSGMSGLAVKVGSIWLAVGLVYGIALKIKRREELRASW
jgi:amino acid transporter